MNDARRLAQGTVVFVLALLLVPAPCSATDLAGDVASSEGADAPLRRFPDPVFLTGNMFPLSVQGCVIGELGLYRYENRVFEPIRFQVDERTPEGDWVFPFGRRNNSNAGNGRVDPQDVLMFMARDAAGRAPRAALPEGATSVDEIEIIDPVDSRRGWVYLARHAGNPPPRCTLPGYVRYDADKEIVETSCTRAEYLITKNGLHTTFYKHHSTPPEAGGSGENLVDRLKFRVKLRFLFNLVPVSLDEERLGSDMVAYILGPVRNVRRYRQFVKLPLGFRGVKTYADVEQYESFASVPVTFNIPGGFGGIVSSVELQIGTDYSPGVIGSRFLNNHLTEPVLIDGYMSEQEKQFPTDRDEWRLVFGPYGVLMARSLYPPELLEMVDIEQGYLDDLNTALPVERYPGSIGYAYSAVRTTRMKPGRYRMFLDFYFPPNYEPGDEETFLLLRDHPLTIRVDGHETENPQHLYGKVGKGF